MKKTNRYNYIILFALFIYAIINRLIIFKYYIDIAPFIAAAFIIVLFFSAVLFIGFKKPRNTKLKRDVTFLTILTIVTYFIVIYMLGLSRGYLTNPYSTTLYYLFYNLSTVIILSVFMELLRYLMIDINKGNKRIFNLTTLALILFEVSISFSIIDSTNSEKIFENIVILFAPIVIRNLSFSYISNRIGYIVPIIFRLLLDTYIYVVPITPDIGDFLYTTLNIILPFIIYYLTYVYEKKESDEIDYNANSSGYTGSIALIILLVAILSSTYYLKSNSLVPKISYEDYDKQFNRGDIVLIKSPVSDSELELGRVIAYKDGDEVHFNSIEKISEDGKEYTVKDNKVVKRDDIIGIARYKIPYIGYPITYLSKRGGKNG